MSPAQPEDAPQEESRDYAHELEALVSSLSRDSAYEQIVSEIRVLQSIYGESAVRMYTPSNESIGTATDDKVVRYEVHLDLPPPHDSLDTRLKILVSLPPTYPSSSPPQLQLLSLYIGPFSVDTNLFGSIIRTFITSKGGVEWLPENVCVFDGVENVRERCGNWFADRLSEEKAQDILREDEKEKGPDSALSKDYLPAQVITREPELRPLLPDGVNIVVSESIVDRKSVFVGRACGIAHPSQVPAILLHLMSERRIARAAHPIINAWRCRDNGILHQDNDDDGETAAGGRIAHLLQILVSQYGIALARISLKDTLKDVDNVLVVVTRYFGGIRLGPDRFKHINQAARNALELGGFLDSLEDRKSSSRLKKKS
ncbi:hypothetical protein EW145_g41 [Phellinidium pouzarii]|uniref:RWD domain-containing protein n=1 Tax=Phellinidium pouzarii TaxID=167371 RepID=A0A4S4LJX7_9AGAM|nr:hypothetical protein EW145_g41 [Phellinidium pouzarii]